MKLILYDTGNLIGVWWFLQRGLKFQSNIMNWMVLTFESTKLLLIIKNKSNIWIFIGMFCNGKQVSASALITSDTG